MPIGLSQMFNVIPKKREREKRKVDRVLIKLLFSQLFKGKFFVCQGEDTRNITNKSDCLMANYKWVRHKYNFDNLGQVST